MPLQEILIPAITLVIGAAFYMRNPPNPSTPGSAKVTEMGRIAYFVGLLWLIDIFAHTVVHF